MKILKFPALSSLILSGIEFNGRAQTPTDPVILMLNKFYAAHTSIWETSSKDIHYSMINRQLDSLIGKYSTSSLRKSAKRYLEDGGFDIMTNDRGMDKRAFSIKNSKGRERKSRLHHLLFFVRQIFQK